ncbi:MAG: GGDEF domain-containing protein [Pirellulales bacterium]|nr:GGDEF domain-containing protein [Pirellulales bacterium]
MIFFGLALSALQLALGLLIGARFARRRGRSFLASHWHARENHRAAKRLLELTQSVTDDVNTHSDRIDDVHAQLSTVSDERQDSETIERRVSELVQHLSRANESLQSRLEEAETNLEEQAAQFQAQMTEARTDALTGLPNRRAFDEQLAARFAEWSRYGQIASLILLDIDRFKDLNDTYGHLTGDAVLQQFAAALGDGRETDIAMRYGGEEFAVLLPHTDANDAEIAAERIRVQLANHTFSHGDTKLSITVSYGLAQFESDDDLPEAIVVRADMALYASKIASRNNGHVHNGRICLPIRADDESLAEDRRHLEVADASEALRASVEGLLGNHA